MLLQKSCGKFTNSHIVLTNGLCSFHYGCVVRHVGVQFRTQNTHDPNQEKEIGYDGHNARNFVHPIGGNIFNPATEEKKCFTDNGKIESCLCTKINHLQQKAVLPTFGPFHCAPKIFKM